MWLGLVALIVIVVALLVAVVAGGIFTLIFLPLAAVVFVGVGGAMLLTMWRRANDPEKRAGQAGRAGQPPSVGPAGGGAAAGGAAGGGATGSGGPGEGSTGGTSNSPSAPTTPDELLDERRS